MEQFLRHWYLLMVLKNNIIFMQCPHVLEIYSMAIYALQHLYPMKITSYSHYQTSKSYEHWPIDLYKSLTMIMASFL